MSIELKTIGDDTYFNKLTPAEAERLALLLEELGETLQAIGKIQRHGYESKNPHDPSSVTNRMQLARELGDVQAAITIMTRNNDISTSEIREWYDSKLKKINQYLHHNKV